MFWNKEINEIIKFPHKTEIQFPPSSTNYIEFPHINFYFEMFHSEKYCCVSTVLFFVSEISMLFEVWSLSHEERKYAFSPS